MWWTSDSRHSWLRDFSQDRHPKIHATLRREDSWRIMEQTNKDCRSRNFTLTNSLHQQHLLVGRSDSKLRCVFVHTLLRKLCCGSKKWRWLNQWMYLKSSRSIRGTHGLDFELLDARTASALNNIIQNTRFKKKVSLEEMKAHKEDRFLRGRQIACLIHEYLIAFLIYEYFRVTGANDSVENHADLFTIVLRNDDFQEFDSKWYEIPLSMTQIPSDDILEILYKSRIRESDKLRTVLELYIVEIHQDGQEDGTGGGGLARVPSLRVCANTFSAWVAHAVWKDELTSCRGTI